MLVWVCGCTASELHAPGPDVSDAGDDAHAVEDIRPDLGDDAGPADASDMGRDADARDGTVDAADAQEADHADAESDPDADSPDATDAAPDLPPDGPGFALTRQGPIEGSVLDGGVARFLGVPFAQPPVGELRWKSPRAPVVRDAVLQTQAFGPACAQADDSWVVGQGLERSEDCLTLNVWAPVAAREPVPVMVWVHGGGFLLGAGSEPQFDGAALAARGAVVVTFNYRLGVAGFLVHEALLDPEDVGQPSLGNYGLLDMLAALAWVRDNAEAFGGDPGRVTLLGESAGGISVCALMTSPLATGLFHRAVMQSGFCTMEAARLHEGTDLLPPAAQTGARLAVLAGCEGPDVAACLRGRPMAALIEAAGQLGREQISLGIAVDEHVLSDTPSALMQAGRGARLPWIVGTVADEGTVFLSETRIEDEAAYHRFLDDTFTATLRPFILVLYPSRDFETPWHAAAAVIGDALFTCPTREAMRAHTARGNPGWLYYFGHVTESGRRRGLGAYHASEVPFLFGTHVRNDDGDDVSELMSSLWWTFARDGRPEAEALIWPAYTARADPVLEIDVDPEVVEQWRDDRCRFWAGGD